MNTAARRRETVPAWAVFLPTAADEDSVCWVDAASTSLSSLPGDRQQGSLEDLARLAAGRPVTVYVPGEDVLLTEVVLPAGRRAQLLRAVPFAVEERIAEDIDDVHVALASGAETATTETSATGTAEADMPRWPVAVVARARLEAWLDRLKAAGLQAGTVLPDIFAVPWTEDAWRVWIDGERCLVRTGERRGFAIDRASLPMLLAAAWRSVMRNTTQTEPSEEASSAGDENNTAAAIAQGDVRDDKVALPQRLYCLGEAADCEWLREQVLPAAGLRLPVEQDAAGSGAVSSGNVARPGVAGPAVDLLQGDYRVAPDWRRRLRPWWPALVLLVLLGMSAVAQQVYRHYTLSAENDSLRAAITQVFRKSFPEVRRIVNPRAQMQYRLGLLRAQAGHGNHGFAVLLGRTAPVLAAMAPALTLRSVRYEDGQMQLGLDADTLQTLDTLKQRLAALPGLSVTLESASARDGRAQGSMRVKEGSA